ncbi:MAG: hydrogenase small subunit [Chlorobi bacterium]|nr:hydrogenase small subunit [Chlorobiota bacterium]
MSEHLPTMWEEIRARGYSRRDFLKFCAWTAAFLGLESSGIGQIVHAMETKTRLPVIWLHGQECTCCSESFIRTSHPIVGDIILDHISLDYTETLQAASGFQAEKCLHDTMTKYKGKYILCFEGSIPTGNDGVYCCIAGKTMESILEETAADAKAIIAWGNCATYGCIQAAKPNPTEAKPVQKLISGKPIINVPGCPPIAEVMAGTILYMLTFDRIPALDGQGRPKTFYSRRVHDTCYRRPNYDAGLFVETFDDENAKKGYCLYKVGCRGPVTYNSCAIMKWNNGVSYPIQSGHGCLGCSELNFWDNGPFYQHLASFPGFGIESTADDIGIAIGVATATGIAAHAVSTNIRKRKLVKKEVDVSRIKNIEKEGGNQDA